jgi:hypothetical protein
MTIFPASSSVPNLIYICVQLDGRLEAPASSSARKTRASMMVVICKHTA